MELEHYQLRMLLGRPREKGRRAFREGRSGSTAFPGASHGEAGRRRYGARMVRIKASMWSRYLASAAWPASVRRYSVFGTRPSKLFSQAT